MDDTYVVSIAKGEDCYETTRKCLENVSLGDMKPDGKVFIKINLSTKKKPELGMTTHPEVVEAFIDAIRSVTGDITIIESDSSDPTTNADTNFDFCGFAPLLSKGITFVNLSRVEKTLFTLEKAKILKNVEFASLMKEYDVLVNVPVLKTHSMIGVSLGVKNLFGLIPKARKLVYHPHLFEVIYDVYCAFTPSLTIIDGMVGCEGWFGELYGNPVGKGVVIAGNNTIAVDLVGARLMGFEPSRMTLFQEAKDRGVMIDEKKIKIVGEPLEKVKSDFKYGYEHVMLLLDLCISGVKTVGGLMEKSGLSRQELTYFLDLFEKYGWVTVEGENLTLNVDEMNADRVIVSRVFIGG